MISACFESGDRTNKLVLDFEGQARGKAIDINIHWVWRPSGSRKSWCASFSANLTTLSSIDGQYRGPTPSIRPVYIGDLSRFARIMSCVRRVVWVIQQGVCSTWNIRSPEEFRVKRSAGSFSRNSGRNENAGGGSSPSCRSHRVKSIERAFNRQGVPVLNLPIQIRVHADSRSKSTRHPPSGHRPGFESHMQQTMHKGPGGDHHRFRLESAAPVSSQFLSPRYRRQDPQNVSLQQIQIRLRFDQRFQSELIRLSYHIVPEEHARSAPCCCSEFGTGSRWHRYSAPLPRPWHRSLAPCAPLPSRPPLGYKTSVRWCPDSGSASWFGIRGEPRPWPLQSRRGHRRPLIPGIVLGRRTLIYRSLSFGKSIPRALSDWQRAKMENGWQRRELAAESGAETGATEIRAYCSTWTFCSRLSLTCRSRSPSLLIFDSAALTRGVRPNCSTSDRLAIRYLIRSLFQPLSALLRLSFFHVTIRLLSSTFG